MNKPFRFRVLMTAAAMAVIVFGTIGRAGVNSDTIGIKFGVNFPPKDHSVMNPADVAGVPGVETANWNNAVPVPLALPTHDNQNPSANLGTLNNLVRDTNGAATTTSASVTWSAEATWASSGNSEENNTFPGDNFNPSPNRKLMLGYLDHNSGNSPTGGAQHTNRVTITGLPADIAGYDVIVYELGGVGGGRGGTYTVNGVAKLGTSGDAATSTNGTFVQDPGDGSGQGNYLRWTGLSGSTVKIRARNDNFRAVINAVEIIKTSGQARANPPVSPLHIEPGPHSLPLGASGLGMVAALLSCGWYMRRCLT
jgi:hypothetical protein